MTSEVLTALIAAGSSVFTAAIAVMQARVKRTRTNADKQVTGLEAQIRDLQVRLQSKEDALDAKAEALGEAIRQRDRLAITAELSDRFFGRLNQAIGGETHSGQN